jgi:ABC-type uncharacterized transport system permease subunit
MRPEDSAPQAATPPATIDGSLASDDLSARARARLGFPVVGIGASAGGVAVLRTFFAATSPDSGIAYTSGRWLEPLQPGRRSWTRSFPSHARTELAPSSP